MTTVVLIHGFSGSRESWRRIRPLLEAPSHAPAVRGHAGGQDGSTEDRRTACDAFEAEVSRLAAEIEACVSPPRCVAGYSLGGRLVLGLLVRCPDLFESAALIGVNPGLGGQHERAVRRAADGRWARVIEERGLAAFDRQWSDLPLFRSQRRLEAEVLEEQRRIRLGHHPASLAAAMKTLSLGAMPDYRPVLSAVACPVELIVGALDVRFRALAGQMAESLPQAVVHVVEGVGHNVPLEAPARLARLLNQAVKRTDRLRRVEPGHSIPRARGRCSVAAQRRRSG